jgi:CRISPR system Cascade subunit CasD
MMTAPSPSCLVLRLAGPLQSWGSGSQFNRRDTAPEPTKSGVIGILAAAQGRRRADPIEDLLALALGVRTDQPGSLLRDYHTASDYRRKPLPSSAVSGKGTQKLTSPAKYTYVTERYYLQDAVFVAAVHGPGGLLTALADAIAAPAFPLALGRRSCVPAQPILLPAPAGSCGPDPRLWPGGPADVLGTVPWQGSPGTLQRQNTGLPAAIDVPVTVDDPAGIDVRQDLPVSFDPLARAFRARPVRHGWAHLPIPGGGQDTSAVHDPFALLGW